jgi:hypothetical protein
MIVPTMLPVEMVVCAAAVEAHKESAEKSAMTNQTGRSTLRETPSIIVPPIGKIQIQGSSRRLEHARTCGE